MSDSDYIKSKPGTHSPVNALPKRVGTAFRNGVICISLWFVFVPTGFCQTTSDQEEEQPTQEEQQVASDVIEEIIIYGDKTLTQMRKDLRIAEEKTYTMFNSLNEDDDFDIYCHNEAPTGSKIHYRVCRANYVSQLMSEATRQAMAGEAVNVSAATIRKKDQALREIMEKLMVERPGFLQALLDINEAQKAYAIERAKRCEGRVFICRQ